MDSLDLKASHKPVAEYYRALEQFRAIGVSHESAVRSAFQNLLDACCRKFGWTLVAEWPIKRARGHALRADGALVDGFRLSHGLWEAKDADDDLRKEVRKKLDAGYPSENILFQAPERAILFQNGREVLDQDISAPENLVHALKAFFEHQKPEYASWTDAVVNFGASVPQLAHALDQLIEHERKVNTRYKAAFEDFASLCRQSVNPNLSDDAVEEMLIQHLLTERIFRKVFNNPDFTRRNVIAAEIEKVIDALTSKSFNRDAFLGKLDHFYRAIETTAASIDDFTQKQQFLNAVYEKFFQGFSVKVADTHGIVYTPQSVVQFMVKSVEDILHKEFGKHLSSPDVHILDPFVGTGNFIVHVMQEIKKTALEHKYKHELHCNEVMLLPYYIASMNIEHEYMEATGNYEPFEGICLVDTFELAEGGQAQLSFMTPENTARVERQKKSPIKVIIGNPPYNAKQLNENDRNKNRRYKEMDRRIKEIYAKDSKATLVNTLSDPYVKAIRWATDRIGEGGVIAFVTNNSFINEIAFDGVRKNLALDFDEIYILDLGGNVRKNPKLSGSTHNVFGIQIGVSINFFIKRGNCQNNSNAHIYYARVDEFWRKEQKYKFLDESKSFIRINWTAIHPDKNQNWLTDKLHSDFEDFLAIGSKEAKQDKDSSVETIFKLFGLGIKTGRDDTVYDFDEEKLLSKTGKFIEEYNSEIYRYRQISKPKEIEEFLNYERMNWSRNLKRHLSNSRLITFNESNLRHGLYRPFIKKHLYFGDIIIDELGRNKIFFPIVTETENLAICATGVGAERPFATLICNSVPDLNFFGPGSVPQWFPFYVYNEDGTNRRENITDWALEEFRSEYKDESISKWDIFHYVYAVLHHAGYRERYAANLKRELPRIPFAPSLEDFRRFVEAGARLSEIHVNYESQSEYQLERIESTEAALDWRVEKMRLSKDKRSIIYNEFLTLAGVPPEAFEYRLGNRSALEWVIDQYRVTTDKRSGITNDPNRAEDPQYIVRLIGQVITVSLETVHIVRNLPGLGLAENGTA